MPLRLIAAILAAVLCWTSLSTHEQVFAFGFGVSCTDLEADCPAENGSVEQHHLDDQPTQGHNHSMGEAPPSVGPVSPSSRQKPPAPDYLGRVHADPALPRAERPPIA